MLEKTIEPKEEHAAQACARRPARARILLVDDDIAARRALEKLLVSDGYAVTTASNGEIALAEAVREAPDLVLTDLEMPKMGDIALCEHLHELDRALPVILTTGHCGMESAIASLRAGAADYLIKPLQYEAVLWRVESTLARRAEARRHEQQREEYLALVSHDLLGPLSNILMCTSLLKQSAESQGLAADVKLATRAEQNVKRMNAMLEELREATTLESHGVALELMTCELRELVAGVVDRMGDAGARRISIEADDASPHYVLGETFRLERVVTNLLTNALKYSADDAPVRAQVERRGGKVELTVVDRGIGIAPENIEVLFDRYYRTTAGKNRASGLGLGLYIARLIVATHGGRIDVSSKVGHGSAFTVTLPAHAGPT